MGIGQVSEDTEVELVEEVEMNYAPSISIVTRGQTAQAFRANRDMHS